MFTLQRVGGAAARAVRGVVQPGRAAYASPCDPPHEPPQPDQRAMTVRDAEGDAAKLLFASWWQDQLETRPLPVDPFQIARGLGIGVRFDRLPADESGRITISVDGGATITLNGFDHDNRKRFTCAHEIGHYIDRQNNNMIGRQEFVDYRSTLAGMGVETSEIYANQFAAALLMPPRALQEGYLGEQQSTAVLARRFGTSVQALELRLRNLNLVR